MKKLYTLAKRKLFILSCFYIIAITFPAKATTLGPGDLVFTGYLANASTTDAFSFVVLVNLSGTTTVSFTDNGWLSTNVFRAGEQTVVWTYTGTLVAGREITISGPSAGAGIAILSGSGTTIGTCTGSIPSFATSGDQIIAYSGTVGAPTFVAGLHMNVYSTDLGQCGNTTAASWDPTCITDNGNFSTMPLGLTAGVSAAWIGTEGVGASEQDNARFNCTGPLLTAAQVRAAATNAANWTANSIAPPAFSIPFGCAFLGLVGLPLDLISFNGNNNGADIRLGWQTANEREHAYFEVEKSADGRNFAPVNRTNAHGGLSYLPFDYTFRDAAPLRGANFYRLKMVDNNGNAKYSSIIKVLFGITGKALYITPNPAVNEIYVSSDIAAFTEVTVANITGQVVIQKKLASNNQKLDVSQLPSGHYSITLAGSGEKITEKFVIAR